MNSETLDQELEKFYQENQDRTKNKKVRKRNGNIVNFNLFKIYNAIRKANENDAVKNKMTNAGIMFAVSKICNHLKDDICNIEDIQDEVEKELMIENSEVAKAYIIYRSEHAKIRNTGTYLMDIFKKLTFQPSIQEDLKRENANINTDSAMGTMLKYGAESSKFFIDNYILPKDISMAHICGDIHIHDKDFYMLTETCCQIDLLKLFKNGFNTGHGFIREPQSIQTAAALACIAIQANQNEMHK